ncbi:hypothetical protein Htur_0336 [Haloterrigena turkmenica DSM 5511]|uniref:Uncharacterized protein n=1 Tax=Haloterrigena turkmenica (strain ATCC 51198 / DSM 5511 / JCM 9101 / NCIMB 13204 / VKM B-1734 / 4k) TaxID=543526 RepID=D2RUU4_HALTV|nr:hypothetical protein [Haloterrigena turkmenica]ADB59237.1 hypothetical protein Htur_0336 [Haloterrigena turkmenica DSM 5511]
MAIPGYDSSNVAEYTLEQVGARVDIVAGVVPDAFGLEKSADEPPVDALADPVDLAALDEVKAIEAMRIALVYDPSRLPPGASPTDVAVAVDTDEGWEPLESTVDLEETTVTAVLNDRPPGSTVVAGYDDRDDESVEPAD